MTDKKVLDYSPGLIQEQDSLLLHCLMDKLFKPDYKSYPSENIVWFKRSFLVT